MKTQTWGSMEHVQREYYGDRAYLTTDAFKDYREKRENGCDEDGPSVAMKPPLNGEFVWIKRGMKEGDGKHHWECQYKESADDKQWMEEKDRNYLARLFLDGPKTEIEKKDLSENKLLAEKAAKKVESLGIEQLSPALKKLQAADELYKKGSICMDSGQCEEAIKCYFESFKLGSGRFTKRKIEINNVNKVDGNGYTLLHYAAKNGYIEIVKYLLSNQANVLATTKDGLTAYDIAVNANQSEIIKILEKKTNAAKGFLQLEELKKTIKEQQKEIINLKAVTENQKLKIEEQEKQLDKLAVSGGNSLENAIDKKDIPEVEKMLTNASSELVKGLSLIPIAHSLKSEKIPKGSISTVEQLTNIVDQALLQPQLNDKKCLKRLMKGISKTLELWRSGKLENAAAVKILDEMATTVFMQLLEKGEGISNQSIQKLFKDKLDGDRKLLWSKWVKKQLPVEQMKEIDKQVEEEIWVSWTQMEKEKNPLATILENYEENTLLNLLIKQATLPQTLSSLGFNDYKEEIINNVSNTLLSAIEQSKVLTPLKATIVQLVKEAQLEKGDELIYDMEPIFKEAIKKLLMQATQGKLDGNKEALQALQNIFKQAMTEQNIEEHLKTYLCQEAVKNLVKDYKEGRLANLEEPIMEAETKLIINYIKPTTEEKRAGFKQVLEDLKNEKINNSEANELFLQITAVWQEKLKAINEITNPMIKILELEEEVKKVKFNWDNTSIMAFSGNKLEADIEGKIEGKMTEKEGEKDKGEIKGETSAANRLTSPFDFGFIKNLFNKNFKNDPAIVTDALALVPVGNTENSSDEEKTEEPINLQDIPSNNNSKQTPFSVVNNINTVFSTFSLFQLFHQLGKDWYKSLTGKYKEEARKEKEEADGKLADEKLKYGKHPYGMLYYEHLVEFQKNADILSLEEDRKHYLDKNPKIFLTLLKLSKSKNKKFIKDLPEDLQETLLKDWAKPAKLYFEEKAGINKDLYKSRNESKQYFQFFKEKGESVLLPKRGNENELPSLFFANKLLPETEGNDIPHSELS